MFEFREMFRALFVTVMVSLFLWWVFPNDPSENYSLIVETSLLLMKLQSYFDEWNTNTNYDPKIFTQDELREYDGEKGSKGLYISILGKVFDVQKGKRHYGPGGAYHVFAGRDASRLFISGDFTGTVTDHVLDLSLKELLSLNDWLNFFENEYIYVGKLSGRYYDDNGERTQYWKDLDKKLVEAEKYQKSKQMDDRHFPPCNVEWTAENGSRVWCTKKSGGIERTWVGVPRKLYEVGSDNFRCACVNLGKFENPNSVQYARRGHIQEYEGCNPKDTSCFVKTP